MNGVFASLTRFYRVKIEGDGVNIYKNGNFNILNAALLESENILTTFAREILACVRGADSYAVWKVRASRSILLNPRHLNMK